MHVPAPANPSVDLICFSHLRWNFVFQRPQHLMTRCARERRVFFVEEPVFAPGVTARLLITHDHGVVVAVPQLPEGLPPAQVDAAQRRLLDQLIRTEGVSRYLLWYYTPMALTFTEHLRPVATVFDCMDELSAFKGAPADLRARERELMRRAGLVLTGGQALYDAKRHQHRNIHACPSSVDAAHFGCARGIAADPDDQSAIPRPRLGFFGVIDERLDIQLIDDVAAARPDWHIVMVGPVVKIDPATLPRRPNIHYLGAKAYGELPAYIAGWDVAMMPFARNDATRFISPTKTPEYLAAGKPVVSTSILDVVRTFGAQRLARIADDATAFALACEAAMADEPHTRLARADAFLRDCSWDGTWARIRALMDDLIRDGEAADALLQGESPASSTPRPARAC